MERAEETEKVSTLKKVVSGFFDYSLSTAVETDHLLTCLTTNLLRTAFRKITTEEGLKRLKCQILYTAACNGLGTNGPFL